MSIAVPTPPLSATPAEATAPTRTADLAALARDLRGELVTPAAPGWDAARQAWNLAVDQRPAAVALPADANDVATLIRFAAATRTRLAFQSTGHGAATLPDLADALLVRMTAFQDIEVDAVAERARVGAGVLVRDLVAAAAAHGLAFTAGSSPDVGVVGYALGGGIGWLSRRYGLACNHIVAAEVVTADGVVRRVDGVTDPELFWALRGGGGSFAAVTALELALVPVREVHAGVLSWPIEQATEVLHAWRDWTEEVPDQVTSIARLLRFPPIPALPEHLRGQRFVSVEAAFLDDGVDADIWLRPLRALKPAMDTFATIPAPALGQLHGDPEQPSPALADHRLVRTLPPAAIDALLAFAGPEVDSPLLSVDIRHLGGALSTTANGHGVLDTIEASHAVFVLGVPMTPELAAALPVSFAALREVLAPWDAGREYLNFAEVPTDPAQLFGGARHARLQAIRA
jgi:hypothetical protein